MVRAIFFKTKKNFLKGFLVFGHANFKEFGNDIVCAGVSSCVFMCCNAILEVAKKNTLILKKEGKISLKTSSKSFVVQAFLNALKNHLILLEQQYKKNVKLKIVEVLWDVEGGFTVFCA